MSHAFVFYDGNNCLEPTVENAFDLTSAGAHMDAVYRMSTEDMMLPQYCQPYLDHSYAMLPTSTNSVELQPMPIAVDASSTDQLAAFIDIEDVSCNTTVVTAPMERNASDESNEGPEEEDPWEGSVTRCICDFQHDDGYMICCDRCGVWQHVDCMGVDRNNIPESYLCELCLPRLIDKRRAVRLQMIKKEQMESDMSATDSSSDELFRGNGSGRKKPGRRRMDGRSNAAPKRPVKRRTSEAGDDKMNDKKNRQAATSNKVAGTRGPRRQSTGESSLRSKRNSAFEADQHVTIDHSVEDVCRNSYTNGVRSLLIAIKDNEVAAGKLSASAPSNPSLLKEQISKQRFRLAQFGPDVKGVAASETIRINQAVAEYTGRVMMIEEFERDNQSESFVPFVLRYAGAQGLGICIDASISGNDIRYIRCSCTPNAKVVHILDKNSVRLFVCATKNISDGREITIPFHFDYQKSDVEVLCACGRASCQVARFFKQKSSSRPIRVRRSAALPILEERPRLTAADGFDNGRSTPMSSGARQNIRRAALGPDLGKTVSPDIGADITLMNALAAISTATAFNCTPVPSPRSTIGSTEGRSNGGHSPGTSEDDKYRTKPGPSPRKVGDKDAAKGNKERKLPGSGGRNKGHPTPPPAPRPEFDTTRIAMIRSNRLRDRAQQLASTVSTQKE